MHGGLRRPSVPRLLAARTTAPSRPPRAGVPSSLEATVAGRAARHSGVGGSLRHLNDRALP